MSSIKSLLKEITLTFLLVSVLQACATKSDLPSSAKSLFAVKHSITRLDVGSKDSMRSVNLSVSYPAGIGQFPLIVFSHGHALDNQSYRNLTDYWVERGYVVVAPLHLDSGGDLQATSIVTEKFGSDWIAASRLLELHAVIDQIDVIVSSLENFQGNVLVDKVIAAGHSYGALSSQQLSGAKVELKDNSIYPIPEELSDDRVVAVVAISPPGLMKGHLTEATWQGYKKPQLVVTGPNDFFPFIWPNYEDHFVSYLTAEKGDNYLLVLDEMDHYLGNLIGRLERDGPAQTLALKNLQEISLLFIQHYLDFEPSANSNKTTRPLNDMSKISDRAGVLRYEHR